MNKLGILHRFTTSLFVFQFIIFCQIRQARRIEQSALRQILACSVLPQPQEQKVVLSVPGLPINNDSIEHLLSKL